MSTRPPCRKLRTPEDLGILEVARRSLPWGPRRLRFVGRDPLSPNGQQVRLEPVGVGRNHRSNGGFDAMTSAEVGGSRRWHGHTRPLDKGEGVFRFLDRTTGRARPAVQMRRFLLSRPSHEEADHLVERGDVAVDMWMISISLACSAMFAAAQQSLPPASKLSSSRLRLIGEDPGDHDVPDPHVVQKFRRRLEPVSALLVVFVITMSSAAGSSSMIARAIAPSTAIG